MSQVQQGNFGPIDFLVFIASILSTLIIGVVYAVKDRGDHSTESYYFGGRKLSPILVGFSISVTFLSSITVIAYPTEIYLFGAVAYWYVLSMAIPIIIGYLYYIPLYHGLQLCSIYELLEMRFNKQVRMITSAISIVNMMVYMGVTIYAPALALSAVTPIDLKWAIALTSFICTIYTAAGGVKAVIWTDVVQSGVILAGILSVFIRTLMLVGGWRPMFEAVVLGNRTKFFDFNPDPTLRATTWSAFFGPIVIGLSGLCSNQLIPQRYLSCKSLQDARKSLVFGFLLFAFLSALALTNGLVMYAYFKGCDPLRSGQIKKADQMVPYLSTLIFNDMPGMSGLFVAAAYSGTLSTISSGINALANLLLEDFVLKFRPGLSSAKKLTISKMFAVLLGILVTAIAYLASSMDATVLHIAYTSFGTFGAPVLALFSLAIFVPWCNAKGAMSGAVIGCFCATWIAVGGILHPRPFHKNQFLPTSTQQCPVANVTSSQMTSYVTDYVNVTEVTSLMPPPPSEPRPAESEGIYAISHLLYGLIGFFITVIMGILISFFTGFEDPKKANAKLFVPLFDNRYLPKAVRKFFRFGVPPIRGANGNGTEHVDVPLVTTGKELYM